MEFEKPFLCGYGSFKVILARLLRKAFIFFEKDDKNNEKKPTLKNEKKANKPVSIRFNLQRSLTKRRLGLLHDAKEKLTAV